MLDQEETRTDEELVGLVLAGQELVFSFIYERYYSRAFRLAYGMTGNRETAEDLTQEIFIRAYQKLRQFNRQSSFSTWFYRLAVNLSLNFQRREKRESRESSEDMELPVAENQREVEATIFQKQLQRQVHQAMLEINPTFRMVIILRDIEGLSYEEIAERMNINKGTVASQLNRGRKLLAEKLKHLKGTF